MRIQIRITNDHPLIKINKHTYKKLIELVLRLEETKSKEINVIFCDKKFMRKLNKDFLNKDDDTDVITFNLGNSELLEGEIYISLDLVKKNALRYKVTEESELSRLIIHGLLHLKGYEDYTESGKKEMRTMEDGYLHKFASQMVQEG
jgi:rRNA maturation RNase YbeY